MTGTPFAKSDFMRGIRVDLFASLKTIGWLVGVGLVCFLLGWAVIALFFPRAAADEPEFWLFAGLQVLALPVFWGFLFQAMRRAAPEIGSYTSFALGVLAFEVGFELVALWGFPETVEPGEPAWLQIFDRLLDVLHWAGVAALLAIGRQRHQAPPPSE